MVNELSRLMQRSVEEAPHDDLDLHRVVAVGRRRVRRRRALALGGAAMATAAVLTVGSLASWPAPTPDTVGPSDGASDGVPQPDAPTLRLDDAERAVEGTDFRVLATHVNENLNRDNGQYFDGVTDDGLVLFRDGPRADQLEPRLALLDPATGVKDWLPGSDLGQTQTRALGLGRDRLVLLGTAQQAQAGLAVHVLDRASGRWSTTTWPDLPRRADLFGAVLGPDDRVYLPVPATQGSPPEGGWPVGQDGDVEDADAEGDTFRLWSASLTEPSDVRDEGLTVGSVAFTDSAMVWTDSTNGAAGLVHVRDLATQQERSFDPGAGDRCNLLAFGATDERIVMNEYCGTYDGVRDDRVQVLDTEGDQVVTVQGNGLDGVVSSATTGSVVTMTSYDRGSPGTYAYDLRSGSFWRITDSVSSWSGGGPTPAGQMLYNTPVASNRGMTEHLAELID